MGDKVTHIVTRIASSNKGAARQGDVQRHPMDTRDSEESLSDPYGDAGRSVSDDGRHYCCYLQKYLQSNKF